MIDKKTGKYVFTTDRRIRKHDRMNTVDYVPKNKKKTIYRIRATAGKNRLFFFKVRTKDRQSQVRRFATLRGFVPERITV